MKSLLSATALAVMVLVAAGPSLAETADPLPSWNDGKTKKAIESFVSKVTDKDSPDYVPPADRIAVFDNDGNLWAEKPVYFQLLFAIDRVKALAPEHPEWNDQEPFKSAIAGDLEGVAKSGTAGLAKIVAASHAGMSTSEFAAISKEWLDTAKHPQTGRKYTEMVYRPMLELLDYLRDNDFKTYIVSGGGIEMLRTFSEPVYGIPPSQVVGSSIKTEYEVVDGKPQLTRLPEINFIDDKAGKPIGINQHIGKRPIFASGNSDGDFEMLEWTTAGDGPRFGLLLHHTDADREYAYDRDSHVGRLDKALDQATDRGWTVIDMRSDWKEVFVDVE
ncbi:MAG: HAD family hydrolase [Methyloceanibacter sp.]|nr:HAD family hydrolase [Methyloceanibacter sp.]